MLLSSLLMACFDTTSAPEVAPVAPVAAIAEAPIPLRFTMTSLQKASGDCAAECASFEATWPVFEGGGSDAINAWIVKAISSAGMTDEPLSPEAAADVFIADWVGYRTESADALGWEMNRTVSVVFESRALVVVGVGESSYTGGAHGNYGSTYATFVRQTGEPLSLSDILVDGYEDKLRPHIVVGLEVALEASLGDADLYHTAEDVPLAGDWEVNGEALVFHYDPYEIGPYVMGAPSASIPREKIQALIRTDSLW